MPIVWTDRALKDGGGTEQRDWQRIVDALERFHRTAHGDVVRLQGYNAPTYRIRAGDYRAIFERDGEDIYVIRVRHRSEAY